MGMAVGTAGQSQVKSEPNVVPMIDVMLVLLIIFMIVTPLISAGFKATMPKGANLDPDPEGENEVILGITRFMQNVTFDRQSVLNPEGINALRYFPGRSNRIWGARTMSAPPGLGSVKGATCLSGLSFCLPNSLAKASVASGVTLRVRRTASKPRAA